MTEAVTPQTSTGPAMEFKREGLVLGLGCKLFTIAGPVLVWGVTASVIVGLIYAIFPW